MGGSYGQEVVDYVQVVSGCWLGGCGLDLGVLGLVCGVVGLLSQFLCRVPVVWGLPGKLLGVCKHTCKCICSPILQKLVWRGP